MFTFGDIMEGYTNIDIELDDELFMALALEAHKQSITFNELVNNILRESLANEAIVQEERSIHEARNSFIVTLIDADDGSGDVILPLPLEFIKEEDWREDDELDWYINEHKEIILTNLTKKERDGTKK